MWWMFIGGCVTGYQQAQAERCAEAIYALDQDGDGAVAVGLELPEACEGLVLQDLLEGYELESGDCDDEDPERAPGREDFCEDGTDQDCDGADWGGPVWYQDRDEDGYGDPDSSLEACDPPTDWLTDGSDCNDEDATVSPGAEQIGCGPGAVDTDCDGSVDCAVLDEAWDFLFLGPGRGGVLDGRGDRAAVNTRFGVYFFDEYGSAWQLGDLDGDFDPFTPILHLSVSEDGWAKVGTGGLTWGWNSVLTIDRSGSIMKFDDCMRFPIASIP